MTGVSGAPWSLAGRAVVWLASGPRRTTSGAWVLGELGGAVRYSSSPVGEYAEVFALRALRSSWRLVGQVPFMAVDSPASVTAGRANWALPKALASLEGDPASRLSATGEEPDPWSLTVRVRSRGPRLPVRVGGTLVQVTADGRRWTTRCRGSGRVRPALVTIESGGAAAHWLPSGRRVGGVVDLRLHLEVPRTG